MPEITAALLAEYRHITYVAGMFLQSTCDRNDLRAATVAVQREEGRQSKSAFARGGVRGGTPLKVSNPEARLKEGKGDRGSQETGKPEKTATREKPKRGNGTSRTWLTPYYVAFREAYKEPPSEASVKMMVRSLRALEKEHGADETLRRYKNYLAATPARFYKAAGFAERFAAYKDALPTQSVGGVPAQLAGEDGGDYAMRLARAGY